MRPDECGADARLPASHRSRHGDVMVSVTPAAPVVKPEDLVTITMPKATAEVVKSLVATSARVSTPVTFTLHASARERLESVANAMDETNVFTSDMVSWDSYLPSAA